MVGFDAKNKDILDPKFICPLCSLILRDPVQLRVCGHRQCQSCFDTQQENTIKCVQCSSETSADQPMIDRGFKNDMQSLLIICSICPWTGLLKDYQEHLDQSHPNPKCEYCNEQFHSVNALNQHKVLKCQKLTIDCVAGGIKTLNNDRERFNNEVHQWQTSIQTLNSDLLSLKMGIQEMNDSLNEPVLNQTNVSQHPTTTNEQIDDFQLTSYDGTYVWKITNVQGKMADAQSDRQTSICSPPFHSSPTGYKMRARLYLHGNGDARRTHISIFFVLMRSEYDAILTFPFNFNITFCLYDQTSEQKHVIDSFRPDIKSNSFQRPRSDMNIASGIPKFLPLAVIQQEGNSYVRDDTMFIKIMVDFGGMAKSLLPYALSLNPGLPTNVQQAMIKQEAERRAQQSPTSTTT